MSSKTQAGSNLPQQMAELPVQGVQSEVRALGAGSFTRYWVWKANGVFNKVSFYDPSITANSRVFVSISEYLTDAEKDRFIGAARMAVYNVAPFNGGFFAWVEISWGTPLTVRFDVLVDP